MTHALLRIAAGLFFLLHGGQKLLGWFRAEDAPAGDLPPMMMIAGILELFGGLAILLGLFTRPIAFLLSGEMAVAYFMTHVPNGGIWPIQNRGEAAALFCFIFFFLFGNGAGPWSLDQMMRRKRTV
ncbi:MAG TPA: DoxX family protein [Candidatus Limnocylindria bacterium]|nr:DoxX family protein [Candidatus Limnocylindria bacterium]